MQRIIPENIYKKINFFFFSNSICEKIIRFFVFFFTKQEKKSIHLNFFALRSF